MDPVAVHCGVAAARSMISAVFCGRFVGQFDVHEVESVERMVAVLDAAVHVHAAAGAGVALNRGFRVDDLELLRILGDFEFVA